jgi:hypothetical protein
LADYLQDLLDRMGYGTANADPSMVDVDTEGQPIGKKKKPEEATAAPQQSLIERLMGITLPRSGAAPLPQANMPLPTPPPQTVSTPAPPAPAAPPPTGGLPPELASNPAYTTPTDIGDPYTHEPGARPGSKLDEWTRKRKKAFEDLPEQPMLPWSAQAGALPSTLGGGTGALSQLATQAQAEQPQPLPGPVPLPRARPAAADMPPPAQPREADGAPSTAPNAPGAQPSDLRSTNMQAGGGPNVIQQTGQQAGMLPDLGSKIMQGLHEHSNMLLALGAGLMGAPNVWQGMSRGFAGAIPAMQADIKMQTQAGGQQAVYNALRAAGAPHNLALAATQDADVRKQMMETYITGQKYDIKPIESTNSWGEKTTRYLAVDPRDPSKAYYIDNGQHIGAEGAANAGPAVGQVAGRPAPEGAKGGMAQPMGTAGAPPQQQSAFYAPGVSEETLDQNKVGEDYLNQFSPDVRQAVVNYLHGNYDPRGNKQIGARVKFIAQKYGHDIGMEADDQKVNQRRTYETGLATPDRGVGKQITGFHNSLQHMGDISDNLVKMHLSNAWEIPGGAYLAQGINRLKGSYPEQAGLISENQGTAQYLSREMGKMSGGTSKGEAQETADRLGGGFKSGKEAAGALRSARKIIEDNLNTMTDQRDALFPDERYRPAGAEFTTPKQQALLDKIDRNIAILEGRQRGQPAAAAPAAAPAAAAPMKPGTYKFDKYGNPVSGP